MGLDDWLTTPSPPPPPAPPPAPPPVHAKAVAPAYTTEDLLRLILDEQQRLAKQQTYHLYGTVLLAVVTLAYLDRILHRLPPPLR